MSVTSFDSNSISLPSVLNHIVFTRARLGAHPQTAYMVADWDDQLQKWKVVLAQEVELESNQTVASAGIRGVDDELDDTITTFAATLVGMVKNKRQDDLYKRYFGTRSPTALKRPVLGAELETVKGWVPGLLASGDAVLVDFGKRFEALVAAGEAAQAKKIAAEAAMADFRHTGARKQFFDALNALRKATDGKLSEMPHAMPALRLPKDFANRFFLHTPKSDKPETVADFDEAIAEQQKELAKLQRGRDAAAANENVTAGNVAKKKAEDDQKRVDAAQRRIAEAQAEIAAIKGPSPKPE